MDDQGLTAGDRGNLPLDEITRPAGRRSRVQPHHIYLLLASIDLFMLAASLISLHTLSKSYEESVVRNEFWADRMRDCLELSDLARATNLPGNEAFRVDADERVRLRTKMLDSHARFVDVRQQLGEVLAQHPGEPATASMLRQIGELDGPMEDMVTEAKRIFAKLDDGDLGAAVANMAGMDEQYGRVTDALARCGRTVTKTQEKNLADQLAEVRSRQFQEWILGGFIVVMVGVVTIVGVYIARRLRVLSSTLDAYRLHLEELVAERTARLEASLEKLRTADRLASIGTLAAGLGHDMNNVLFPVRCRLEALTAHDLDAAARDEVASIRQSLDYLQQLSDGLRLLALDPDDAGGSPAETDLETWWDDVRPLFLTALPREATLEGMIAPRLPAVDVPAHRLTQALFNLVVNAGEAIGEGGRVRVWARPTERDGQVEVGVTDTGCGMTEEIRRQALDPFFTSKKRGLSTGLGLALVRGVATAAGGEVRIDSAPGRGTTVSITLPVAPGPGDARAALRAAVTIADRRFETIVTSFLRSAGFEVGMEAGTAGLDTVWVTDAGSVDLSAAAPFAAAPGSRLLVLGRAGDGRAGGGGDNGGVDGEEWEALGATVVDESRALPTLRRIVAEVRETSQGEPA